MPPLEEVDCWDTAILWAFAGYDLQGQPKYADPVELNPDDGNGVRWLNKFSWVKDQHGNNIAVDATAVVCQDIDVHSKMWLGRLDDWIGTGSGDTMDQNLMVVVGFDATPDTSRRFFRRIVGLMRFHNA